MLAYIKIGMIVKVPFGRQTKEAVVYKIVRQIPSNIKYKLKYIKSIKYHVPIINNIQFNIARFISYYYLYSFGKSVFSIYNNFSKKSLQNINSTITATKKYPKLSNLSYKHLICDTKHRRIQHYIKIINKAIKNNRSAILLFPEYDANCEYIEKIKNYYSKISIIYSPHDNSNAHAANFLKLKKLNQSVVIGTRNSIFQISNNLGLIILDEPSHFGYKEQQGSHYHTQVIAKYLSQATNSHLIYGDNSTYSIQFINSNIKTAINNQTFHKKNKIIIIDNSQSKSNVFSYPIEQIVQKAINQKKKLLLISRGKKMFSHIICDDCKHIPKCPRCLKILYKKTETSKKIYCPICSYSTNILAKCEKCGSLNLQEFGTTTKRIIKLLKDKFPKINCLLLDNKYNYSNKQYIGHTIFVSDSYCLGWKNKLFDETVLLDWDNWQNISSCNYNQRVIKNIIDICEITKKNIYIQTSNPQNDILNKLANKKFNIIFENDLNMRKHFLYPPYSHMIQIYYKHSVKHKALSKINTLKTKLNKILNNCEISEIIEEGKTRDNYILSLIVKTKPQYIHKIKTDLIKNYKNIKLSEYIINVDPIEI
jgi:primosomal protein N' (replication factor Y)